MIFTKVDPSSLVRELSNADPRYLLFAFLLSLPLPIIGAKRWHCLLKSVNCHISYKESFYIFMGAFPFSFMTPSNLGDIVKAVYLRDKKNLSILSGCVLTEKILDLLMLALFALIGSIFYPRRIVFILTIIAISSIIIAFMLSRTKLNMPIKKSWNDKLNNMFLSLKILTDNRKTLSILMFYTLIFWFLSVLQTMIFFFSLGIDVPYIYTLANIPIAIIIGLVPITLGGMGTRDSAIMFLFSEYASMEKLLGVGILFSLFRKWLFVFLGIPFTQKLLKKM